MNSTDTFVVSEGENLTWRPKTVSITQNFVYILFKVKVTEKASDIDIRREQESTHFTSLNGEKMEKLWAHTILMVAQGCEHTKHHGTRQLKVVKTVNVMFCVSHHNFKSKEHHMTA